MELDIKKTKDLRGKDLIKAILEIIKKNPQNHYQGNWGRKNECGTVACVAGWASILTDTADFHNLQLGGKSVPSLVIKPEYASTNTFVSLGRSLLEIEGVDAEELFYLLNEEAAIYALEKYLETGKFDWDEIKDRFDIYEDDEYDDYDDYPDDDDEEDEED